MCAASACVREDAGWWEDGRETRNGEIIREWEAREGVRLTENMINYLMGELKGYAQLRDAESGIEPGPYNRIWKCSKPASNTLHQSLVDAVVALKTSQDQLPPCGGKRTHLLDPLLHPCVYGRTYTTSGRPGRVGMWDDLPSLSSNRFRMLPSDFRVDDAGGIVLVSPYINGLYVDAPQSPGALLRDGLCALVERAVPMFERVLSDLGTADYRILYGREPVPSARVEMSGDGGYPCIWADAKPPAPPPDLPSAALEAFYADHTHRCRLPDSRPAYDGALHHAKRTVSLRGRDLQIVVRISEVSIEPGQALEESWHVEGAMNDAIVAIFTYCLSSSETASPTIEFRDAVCTPRPHSRDPEEALCMRELYGIYEGAPCAQIVGHAPLRAGRALCYPNLYQTRLSTPSSADPLVFVELLLVDPFCTPIASASSVHFQDALWVRRALTAAGVWEQLPIELWDIVFGYVPGLIAPADALRFHAEMLAEQEAIQREVDEQRFGLPFHLSGRE